MKTLHIGIKEDSSRKYTAGLYLPTSGWINMTGDKMITQSGDRLIFGKGTEQERSFIVAVKENKNYDII